jgi:hypothetical protein
MASGARGQPRSAGLAPGPDPASSPTSGGCARSAGADSRAPSRVGSGSCDSAPAALAPRTFLLGMVAAAGGGNVDAERGDAVARGFGRSRGRSRLLFTLLGLRGVYKVFIALGAPDRLEPDFTSRRSSLVQLGSRGRGLNSPPLEGVRRGAWGGGGRRARQRRAARVGAARVEGNK